MDFKIHICEASVLILMGKVWTREGVDGWCVDGRCVDTGAWTGCVWTVNKGTSDVYGRGIGPCGCNLQGLVGWFLMMSCLVK